MGQEDLSLRFSKGIYSPYATNLKHLVAYLGGYYIKGQIRFQDMKPLDPLFLSDDKLPAVREWLKHNLTEEEWKRLERIEQFICGFKSPFGLELLASVLCAVHETKSTEIPNSQ